MKWFKHKSNMRHDIKLKRVINKYGLEGYGLYNLIVESIVESLETDSPLPLLQDNVEDIATFYNANSSHVAEMVNFMVNQELFDFTENNNIMCVKVYKHIQASQTRSQEIRNLIANYDEKKLLPQTVSDKSEEKTRLDYTKQEKNIPKKTKPKKKKYGEYKNVLLSDDEYEKLKEKVDDRDKWIIKLDEYIEQTGKKYQNHSLVMTKWYNKEPKKKENEVIVDWDYDLRSEYQEG